MIKVNALDGLIGDFLGCVPAIQALAKRESVCVTYHPEVKELFEMTGLTPYDPAYHITKEITINCTDAWNIAIPKGLHMTQAYFPLLGLDIPGKPVRAELVSVASLPKKYDYVIAPFSRSLPDNQKWRIKSWVELARSMPANNFLMIGHSRDYSHPSARIIPNLYTLMGADFCDLIAVMEEAKKGLISIVSGPSHLAFHLGVKNYLITNQRDAWGVNPDSVQIRDFIPDLKAETIKKVLDEN
ncbi:MAG TPA: hypothetical protein PL085_11600 [Agriterribacter sp.]|uniref:hypothetical protein n=1 Tax=Agriterribacter sp. TaxID=2821509 RepID=UPI002C210018|nr:hypothetical protein [Agriterribacter sp.]HRQ17714.1 hypothetical protein [Agriterribacter sp.]